jgi:hypothetical protein
VSAPPLILVLCCIVLCCVLVVLCSCCVQSGFIGHVTGVDQSRSFVEAAAIKAEAEGSKFRYVFTHLELMLHVLGTCRLRDE